MRPAAPVSGFAAWYITNVLTGPLTEALRRHEGQGQIHPARLAEVRETWALIKQMGDDYIADQRAASASGSTEALPAEMPQDSPREIDTDTAAGMLGVSASRVRQMLRAGVLGGRKVDRRTWVTDRASVLLCQQTRSEAA